MKGHDRKHRNIIRLYPEKGGRSESGDWKRGKRRPTSTRVPHPQPYYRTLRQTIKSLKPLSIAARFSVRDGPEEI